MRRTRRYRTRPIQHNIMGRKNKARKTIQRGREKTTFECIRVISFWIFSDKDDSDFPTGLKKEKGN